MTLVQPPPANLANGVTIDREAVLNALQLNPRDPKVQALVLVCQQYGLDPVLKHAVLISGNLYVTRDGLLAVAHRTGNLDGITVEEEGENADEWWAKVSVHVKGQAHPYTYRGRYSKNGTQKKYGPEMAVKCAEVMALRRAFGVTGIATVEEQWDAHDDAIAAEVVEPPSPDDPLADREKVDELVGWLTRMEDPTSRKAAKSQFVQQFGLPANLRESQWDDAEAWVAQVVAGSEPVVAGDGPGSDVSTGGTVPAESEEAPAPEASPAPPDYDELVPSFIDPPAEKLESAHPATVFHEAIKAALPYLPVTYTDSDLRHQVVKQATEGRTEDWRQMDGEALDTAVELLTQVTEGTRVLRDSSLGLLVDIRGPADGPFVPDRLGELRAAIAEVRGLGEAKTLKQARVLATDAGWKVPAEFSAIDGDLLAATLAWVRAQAAA